VFGNEVGRRIKNVKTAWETAVLKAPRPPALDAMRHQRQRQVA